MVLLTYSQLEGLTTIRAFGWQDAAIHNNIRQLDVSQTPFYLMFCIQRWLNLVLDLLVAGLAMVTITLAVTLRGTTTGAQIGIALNIILVINVTVLRIVEAWTQFETSLGAIARIKSFESTTTPEDKAEESFIPPDNWPEEGSIEFHSMTAAYK